MLSGFKSLNCFISDLAVLDWFYIKYRKITFWQWGLHRLLNILSVLSWLRLLTLCRLLSSFLCLSIYRLSKISKLAKEFVTWLLLSSKEFRQAFHQHLLEKFKKKTIYYLKQKFRHQHSWLKHTGRQHPCKWISFPSW